MLLIVVAVIAVKCNSSVMATPGTIMVPSLGYETIQKAVNPANPRDIMKVSSGTYYENVIINKPVSVVGANPVSTVIDGGRVGNVITMVSDNVFESSGIKFYTIGLTTPLTPW